MPNYTDVAQMGEKVNRLYDLLAEAKALASELEADNRLNKWNLRNRSEVAMKETRPLTIDERIHEAIRQEKAFGLVAQNLASCEDIIALTY